MKRLVFLTFLGFIAAGHVQAQTTIYSQNFNTIESGLPTAWSLSINASATTVGTPGATFVSAKTTWGDGAGNFRNVASAAGLLSTATQAQQDASTNRALGLRQSGSFGDPGAAFNLNFGTVGATVTSLSLDLMMLSVQTRSTPFAIQYGIGTNPASFTTLGTYNDPGLFGTTTLTYTPLDFGTSLNGQSSIFFRVVALSGSTGSGSRDTIAIDNFTLQGFGSVQLIPEPSTWALLGIGLLGFGARSARRRLRG